MNDQEDLAYEARQNLYAWENDLKKNLFLADPAYQASCELYLGQDFETFRPRLETIGEMVPQSLEPLVNTNNLNVNLPVVQTYDPFGTEVDQVLHHPSYLAAGEMIYRTGMMAELLTPGRLTAFMTLFFLTSQAGEAGHHCPMACSAGIIRVLRQLHDFPNQQEYLQALTLSSYANNYTGAQFLTEIQGGSDVGQNSTVAKKDSQGHWRIQGEKWFCSNAGAELIFLTARFDDSVSGTKGLALFLVPAQWEDKKNLYHIRKLKNKIGTRSMATAEIEFNGAYAYQVGELNQGFHYAMNDVLHLSRIFNTFSVLAMGRRAYFIAKYYAEHRVAFGKTIIHYPLVREPLARIKSENTAMLAGAFAITKIQDESDLNTPDQEKKLLLRVLVNTQKYYTSIHSVEHIHLALGILAGNGAIEDFSSIPRLLRDCIVCENWEGTHNVLQMQIYKDILKYRADEVLIEYFNQEILRINNKDCATHLKNIFNKFKNLNASFHEQKRLQTLNIKVWTDALAILFNAMSLAKEIDFDNTNNKKACFDYFLNLHQKQFEFDQDVNEKMNSCEKILNSSS